MENKSRSRIAIIVTICVAIVVALALVVWMILAATSNRPVQTTNATQTSLVTPDGISVEMEGLGDDLLVGPIISLKDKDGNAVVDHLEMRGSQSLPGVRAGKYDLSVDAPAIGRDGMVYECLDPIREIVVGDDGSVVIDLDFKQIPIDQMTPEQLQKIKDELEAAGVPMDVVSTVTNTYDPTQQPAGEPIQQQPQVTETWTYVETPQQPQQQQPQQQQPQQQQQQQGHVHNWVTSKDYIWHAGQNKWQPGYVCDAYLCGAAAIADNDDDPMSEVWKEMEKHFALTGHSSAHYTTRANRINTSMNGFAMDEIRTCSTCGAKEMGSCSHTDIYGAPFKDENRYWEQQAWDLNWRKDGDSYGN